MNYRVLTIPKFEKNLKRLVKKYPSLKKEYSDMVLHLKEEPQQGTCIADNCYKIRLAIKSKGKGKSGGARIITHLVVEKDIVYLLTIYDKSDKENLTSKELEELLSHIK